MLKNDLPSVWRRIKITLPMLNSQLSSDIEELYRLACKNRSIQLKAYDDVLTMVRKRRQAIADSLLEDEPEQPPPAARSPAPIAEVAPAVVNPPAASIPKAAKRRPKRKPQFRQPRRVSSVFMGMSQTQVDTLRLELLEAKARGIEDYRTQLDRAVAQLGPNIPRIKSKISTLTAISAVHLGNFIARLIFVWQGEDRNKMLKRLAKLFGSKPSDLLTKAKASNYWKSQIG